MLSAPHASTFYHRLSRLYDGCFAPIFGARAKRTIGDVAIPPGSRVLEVGVGTGASLDAYPAHAEVVGIDLSAEMLAIARQKVQERGWKHIELREMDALNMQFPDDTFDFVMAFHILTVVPDAAKLMREMVRVCRPGGKIVIVNHLRSPRRPIALMLDALAPVTSLLGWHTRLTYEDLLAAAPIHVLRRYKQSPRSLFTVVIAEKPPRVPRQT